MAEKVITPTDEIGMPLPIAPSQTLFERIDRTFLPDEHHHFHPRKSPLLTGTGGLAIRNLRVQLSEYEEHHEGHGGYHDYYEGPVLPDNDQQRFGLAVLGAAGYIPAKAISFDKEEPRIIKLNHDQRPRMWTSGELRLGAPDKVKKFLLDYTTKQNLVDTNEKMVDEFLNTANEDRRHKLGGVLLKLAIDQAIEPIDPFYRKVWKKGYIHRESSHRPRRLLSRKLTYRAGPSQVINRLYDNLADAA